MEKRLYRSRKNRMISGVAGGIAEYFDIDPVIVRALFIIATLGYGTSIVAYIVLWIIVPEESKSKEFDKDVDFDYDEATEPVDENYIVNVEEHRQRRRVIFGIILICLGGIFLIDNVTPWLGFHYVWPLALVAFGAYILYKNHPKKYAEDSK